MASAATPRLATLIGALAAIVMLALGAPTAGANPTPSSRCPGVAEHPFIRWADPAWYVLSPGGDFEDQIAWNLVGGARVVTGNEPFKVHRPTDGKSLSIPVGGSATTPSICVGLGDPTLRWFAVGGGLAPILKVDVIYRTALGMVTQPVTLVPGTGAWSPTLQTPFLANAIGIVSADGLTAKVKFRFTALRGNWKVDDVYVDPWKVT